MSDVMTRPPVEGDVAIAASTPADRRRASRIEDASPELLHLLRNPVSREARVRVALYDAPGFLLPTGAGAQRPRVNALRVTAAIVASGAVWGVAFKAMCIAWG